MPGSRNSDKKWLYIVFLAYACASLPYLTYKPEVSPHPKYLMGEISVLLHKRRPAQNWCTIHNYLTQNLCQLHRNSFIASTRFQPWNQDNTLLIVLMIHRGAHENLLSKVALQPYSSSVTKGPSDLSCPRQTLDCFDSYL